MAKEEPTVPEAGELPATVTPPRKARKPFYRDPLSLIGWGMALASILAYWYFFVRRPIPEPGERVARFTIVEGRVRVLDGPDQSDQFQLGEILVAVTTNVGWTPIFPRAAAVVTDVGAPLSHAAIVARELGIPAVVGCGSATTRLRTGDWVRVDGGQGTVEILGTRALPEA